MHNSQAGEPMAEVYSNGQIQSSSQALGALLISDCIGCHAGSSGATNTHGAPIVVHTSDPLGQGNGHTLAGGDFYWVASGLGNDYETGHNVEGLADADSNFNTGTYPPGWDENATAGLEYGQIPNWDGYTDQVTCAGTHGCHGNHTDEDPMSAIKGAHHNNLNGTNTKADADAISNASHKIGASYRFLAGIYGLEDPNWNWSESAGTHNEYYGPDGNSNYADKHTISYFCAECHGDFHSDIGSSSPWLRHPTDIVLPDSGEYANYNPNNPGQYSVEAPVARPTVPDSPSATVNPGDNSSAEGAIVMCLSCHRAHGSDQPDLLRWDYEDMIAGNAGASEGTGCFVCHTEKD